MSATELFLGRQPILDARGNLVAFELLFRSGQFNGARIDDDVLATATVINHAFSELGADAVLGHFTGFINLPGALLMSDVIELLPKERVVLEVLESVEINEALLARLAELRAQGFRLALDDFVGDPAGYAAILPLLDVIKVDVAALDDARLESVTAELRKWPLRLLAEKVDTREQVERCIGLGYELFQGYYFARPSIIKGKRLSHAESAIMRLIGLVVTDASTTDIEQVFKQNPDLSVNLLRLVNSVAVGSAVRINSLHEAIAILGRSQLQRWLQLLMFAASSSAEGVFPSPLLVLAATRGKLMELLSASDPSTQGRRDEAFLTGIMSLLGALLGAPIEEIVASLPVPDDVLNAVLDRTGPLGALLALTEEVEQTDIAAIERHLEKLPALDPVKVNAAYVGAIEWANGIIDAAP